MNAFVDRLKWVYGQIFHPIYRKKTMNDRRVMLKIKLKSLAEESRIIRKEENKRKVNYFHLKMVRNGESIEGAMERVCANRKKYATEFSLQTVQALHLHRINDVRNESRLTLIAYALVRERKVADTLQRLSQDDWKRITGMVKKYGNERSTRGAEALQSQSAAGSNPAERAA